MNAEILTIGDEILIGQIVDTNSAWIGETMNRAGIEVYRITSVHDEETQIVAALDRAIKDVDIVLITGGLGPTKDDITQKTLCRYFQTELIFHEPTYEHIKERFRLRNIDMNKLNRDQALVPKNCTVLFNKTGTAPGMWFEKNGTIIVSVPGVPFEMKYLVENEVIPRLVSSGKTKAIVHKTVLTQGIPESILALKLEAWEMALPENVKLAYLPSPMAVRLRLSATGKSSKELEADIDKEISRLKQIIPDYIYGYGDETLAEVIGRILIKSNKTLSVAESCTGGYISHLITSISGSSAYYAGSVTAYANQAKQRILAVKPETLEQFGAVSEQTAREMALGAKRVFNTDFAIATTGIAGPTGGTEDKQVGTVWIAIAGVDGVIAEKFVFGDNRERNIVRSSQTALQMLRCELTRIYPDIVNSLK
ncbi:MAG: competence/damage-inducible protein A [Draconibacterium sp.]|nr:MAG: competence/damage-inducible protein A [Draconibacterium sp.]PIF05152.1 MAG: competence/damage-inducible protein A [Draconibacterium sp.]